MVVVLCYQTGEGSGTDPQREPEPTEMTTETKPATITVRGITLYWSKALGQYVTICE